MGVRVGIDTGGTFTDLVAVDEESRRWFVAKVPSGGGAMATRTSATAFGSPATSSRASSRPARRASSTGGAADGGPIRLQVWETVVTPCQCCGQVVAKQLWVSDVEGQELRFCGPGCEQLYRTYVLPKKR